METSRWERIQSIFHSVADLPQPERDAALAAACGDDTALKSDVMAMLEQDAQGTPFFERTLDDLAQQALDPRFANGHFEELGPYQVTGFLGEGGMGVVYLAQRKDLGSLVAIKLLRDAWLSPARRERFAVEQKTLAQLNHPGIARLYDAGILKNGTPWFVMEYVKGIPLNEFCRAHPSSIVERLRLFRSVCEAVQYAHGQAIIHRDLKPSNILVTENGTAKLLDFGIAKHLEETEAGNETRTFLRLMTPGYAAPEQIRGERIGTYTDVYSLGVILYELLTGSLPFDLSRLTPGEADHVVVENEPQKPSAVAHQRGGVGWQDLDVLCLTAMRKEAGRRYQSAEALIRDIDHYLKEEPLEARPDSLSYKTGKFIRRNRRTILAASLVFASVVGLVIFFLVRLTKARNAAEAETARTHRVEDFMIDLVQGGDPEAGPSSQLSVTTLLDHGARQAAELDADPEIQVDLYRTLGTMYQLLGDFKKSEPLLESALAKAKAAPNPDVSRVVHAMVQLGLLRNDEGQYQASEDLMQQAVTLARSHFAANDLTVLDAQANLGRVLAQSNSPEKAIPILVSVIRANPSGKDGTLILQNALSTLTAAQYYVGQHDAAKDTGLRTVALDRQVLGRLHPRTGMDLMSLATAEASLGENSAAERHYRESIGIVEGWYGPNDKDAATMRAALAALLIKEGRDEEAETLLKQALATQQQTYGPMHDYTAFTLDMLGRIALRRNDAETARSDFSRSLAIDRSLLGDDNPRTAAVKVDLGDAYIRQGKYAEADSVVQQAVNALHASLPATDLHIGLAQATWGRALLHLKRYREAETQLTASYQIFQAQPQPPAARMQEVQQDLAQVNDALRKGGPHPDYAGAKTANIQ
jgi:serine/threonine-protein kinase